MKTFQLLTLTLSFFAVPGMGRYADPSTDLQLLKKVLAPYRFEDLNMFSDRPENYAKSDDPNDIGFYLYNDAVYPEKFYPIQWNDDSSLLNLPWIQDAPVKVLIHGFTQSQNSSMPAMVKNAYLEVMLRSPDDPSVKVNVISVDWGQLAGSTKATIAPIYSRAVRNVETAGKRVGELIANLIKLRITTHEKVHVVGFSLGGHVAGWAGKMVKDLTDGRQIRRITGLDPAGPFFTSQLINFQSRDLNTEDAQLVDVIHTSWGSYGIPKKCGHADFFPNFHMQLFGLNLLQTQPYCFSLLVNSRPIQVCSHNMAPIYFSMSILKTITACKCKNYADYALRCGKDCTIPATFGEYYEHKTPGDYFLTIPDSLLFNPAPEQSSSETSESSEENGIRRYRQQSNSQNSEEEDPSVNEIRRYRGPSYGTQGQRLSACHQLSASTFKTIRTAASSHGLTFSPPRPVSSQNQPCASSSSSLVVFHNSLDETYRLQRFSCQQGYLSPGLQPPVQLKEHSVAVFGVQSDDHKTTGLNCTVEYATRDKSSGFRVYVSNFLGEVKAGQEYRKNVHLNTVVGRGSHNVVHFMIY